jgi:hypothetical protein
MCPCFTGSLHASHISLPASHIQTVIASEARLSAAIYEIASSALPPRNDILLFPALFNAYAEYLLSVGTHHGHIAVNSRRGFDICSQ